MATAAALTPEQREYAATLEGFCRLILGFDPIYPWMQEVWAAIQMHKSRVSLRTANGAGKTTRIFRGAILWHMVTQPRSRVIYTTSSGRQLKYQLWPTLAAYRHRFDGWEFSDSSYSIIAPNGAQFVGFVTDDAGRAEGWHGNKHPLYDLERDDGPLMICVDEAKSVPDVIFDAIERCTYQRYLEASSPGYAEGAFYRHHTLEAKYFTLRKVDSAMCPHVDADKNAEMIARFGKDHPLVMSKVFAEFMSDAEGVVIPLRVVESAIRKAPEFRDNSTRRAHCDFAAGGDENVFALREGNRITIPKAWRESDTMKACVEFIAEFRRHELRAEDISGDNGGLGKPMIDRLHELGWPIQRIDSNQAALDDEAFCNWSAESWHQGKAELERGQWIIPDDEVLKAQFASRKMRVDTRGRLGLESKEDMRKRGVSSPDRADAVLELIRPGRRTATLQVQGKSRLEQFWDTIQLGSDPAANPDDATLSGAHAGL